MGGLYRFRVSSWTGWPLAVGSRAASTGCGRASSPRCGRRLDGAEFQRKFTPSGRWTTVQERLWTTLSRPASGRPNPLRWVKFDHDI